MSASQTTRKLTDKVDGVKRRDGLGSKDLLERNAVGTLPDHIGSCSAGEWPGVDRIEQDRMAYFTDLAQFWLDLFKPRRVV